MSDFLRAQARTIRDDYIGPPFTTDFAILFVPTEGLYAEMMARAGFAETLQREYRVTLTGPSNFLALLNSLQMGFRTLAIERRSSEVWRVLGAVKTEFGKFGDDRESQGEESTRRATRSTRPAWQPRDYPAIEGRRVVSDEGGERLFGSAPLPSIATTPPGETK